MNSTDYQILAIRRELLRRKATDSLFHFIMYLKWDYHPNWHHRYICDTITDFVKSGKSKKLMLFLPPQHGKSEVASRMLPAWLLGMLPNHKIAGASYSIDLARSFNREIQRYIDSKEYRDVFPETFLNSKNVVTDAKGAWLRNSEEFEIVSKKGSYKSVGIMGGLSGRTVDFAIIDDPVKDAIEANSQVYRERVWEWYLNVLETRLHNKSKVVLIMTRWHESDLAGRLLEAQPDAWKVIKIPAIMNGDSVKEDPRKIGEPLWPERHNLEKLLELKAMSETTFSSLYQQNPIVEGGNKIKREWFEYCHEKEVPSDVVWDMWIDGAYTKNTANDPTGLMIAGFSDSLNKLFVKHAHESHMEMPAVLRFVSNYADIHRMNGYSRVYIEPKATGKTLIQLINSKLNLSAVEIQGALIQEGKEARIQTAAPKVQSGKVVLIKGNWNDKFIHQLTGYPNASHDEFVDLLGYACDKYFTRVTRAPTTYF